MNGTLIKYGLIAVAVGGFFAWTAYQDAQPQTADLGQVLDRADFALTTYDTEEVGDEVTEAQMQDFTLYMTYVMNGQPSFYDQPVGMRLEDDATFMGYADANANLQQDEDEKDIFKLEVDTENSRLIATDMTGETVGHRFSGGGLLAGLIIGNLLARQTRAGVNRSTLANKQAKPRSSYTSSARSRSRAGGSRVGK